MRRRSSWAFSSSCCSVRSIGGSRWFTPTTSRGSGPDRRPSSSASTPGIRIATFPPPWRSAQRRPRPSRRAALAALALLAKPHLFVWAAIGLAIPALFDARYRRFVALAAVLGGALVVVSWLAFPDWFPAWTSDVLPRRTGRSAVLFSAFGQLFGTPGRVLAIAVIGVGIVLASRFEPGSDPWLAIWLALSSAGAIYSWSADQVLLFVPIVIASGVLVAAGREVAARRLAIGGALTFLLVSPLLYAIAVWRHDETFSIVVPVAFFVVIAWSLWPYRRAALVRQRPAQQVQPA